MSLITNYKYIQKETEESIKNFKYKGGSSSIVYTYLWSPLCQFLVDQLPQSIAPNTITIIAFSFVVFTHILMVYSSPELDSQVPSWILVLTGISTLTYQVLDNMDGKQARRTNSSTPLGMLFDHGLDSITSWIFGINQIICFGIGSTNLSLFSLLFSCYIGFYTAQWSQYHIGYLELGKINAVDEGLILVWNLLFLTSIVGVSFWQQEVFQGYKLNEICGALLLIMGIMETIQFTIRTLRTKTSKGAMEKLRTQFQSVILMLTCVVVSQFSPTSILKTKYMYPFIVSFGLVWSKSTLHLQIAHLGEIKNYNQWRISFVTLCLAHIFNTISGAILGACLVNEKLLISLLFVYAFGIYLHTSTNVVKQMSSFLGIQVFSLKYKNKTQ